LLQQRVELNALSSDRLVGFIEDKLTEHRVKKIVPPAQQLQDAYRLFVRGKHQEQIIRDLVLDDIPVDVPDDLTERVSGRLKEYPAERWDEALRMIVCNAERTNIWNKPEPQT
jgi:hypothetical protein